MSKDFDDLWEDIKTQRDELRVQAHLAKAEVKDSHSRGRISRAKIINPAFYTRVLL